MAHVVFLELRLLLDPLIRQLFVLPLEILQGLGEVGEERLLG